MLDYRYVRFLYEETFHIGDLEIVTEIIMIGVFHMNKKVGFAIAATAAALLLSGCAAPQKYATSQKTYKAASGCKSKMSCKGKVGCKSKASYKETSFDDF